MSKFSRRKFVATGLAGAGVSAMPSFMREANAAPMTRFDLMSPNGQAMLKKYAQAVKIMMATPATSPLSWTFQWYTHAVPSNTTKSAQLAAIFGAGPSPAKTLATQMWDTCQAHFNAADEPYFLPWHRMYVCFFEMIIRKVLNDNAFTLPYWNYSVPAGYPLPAQFRMPADPLFGPLFRPNRRAQVNAGQPIFTGMGVASDLSPAGALAHSNYLPSGANPGFNQALDQGLHGNVHVFVGNGQGMGSIPWAANDPIFWMHHCNIDRLWVVWNSAGHANPGTAAWLNKTFVFATQNGQPVTAVVKDYTNTVKCNYRYDELINVPRVAAAQSSLAAATPLTVAESASAGAVPLGSEPVRVSLRSAAAAGPSAAATSRLASRLAALPGNRRIYLVIKDLSASVQPEAIYRVYFDLPEGRPEDPLNSHYVGSFTFFDTVPHGEDHATHGSKPYSFDITEIVANLQAQNLLKEENTVTIVPFGQPAADAKTVVGTISLVEQ
jgi:tyrosinase